MNFEKITEYLDSLEARGIPSVDCMIYRNHELVYRHMNGTTDEKKERKIDGSEVYLMFSMTKVQTMTAVLQLVEQGKLSLEDEVGKYLPAYQNLTVKKGDAVEPLTTPLKIKHLVSMQSGLDYDLNRPGIVRVLKEKGNSKQDYCCNLTSACTLHTPLFSFSPLDFSSSSAVFLSCFRFCSHISTPPT